MPCPAGAGNRRARSNCRATRRCGGTLTSLHDRRYWPGALAGARDLRERVAAKDLTGAKKAWISARAGWERSEVFTAGFVPELDAQIDAWPNADSAFHAIGAKLFGAGRTDVESDTDALVGHLGSLHAKLRDMPLTPQGLLVGTARLAYEVGESKADGGESRISGTSLDDMRNNVAGIDFAYRTIFTASLRTVDIKLAEAVDARIARNIKNLSVCFFLGREIAAGRVTPHTNLRRTPTTTASCQASFYNLRAEMY